MSNPRDEFREMLESTVRKKYEEAKKDRLNLKDAAKEALDDIDVNASGGLGITHERGVPLAEDLDKPYKNASWSKWSNLEKQKEIFLWLMEQKLLTLSDHPEMWAR